MHAQKSRAKEDCEAVDWRFRKFSEDPDRRAREDRESTRVPLREHSESTNTHLSKYSDKNEAEHARLFALVDEVKTKVEVLLDRPNRPGGGGPAD